MLFRSVVDQLDPANDDACIPNSFATGCGIDTDGDGISDSIEGQTTDTDGDGIPDYLESSITDSDSDGVVDQLDPANSDACVPNGFATACSTDSDGDGRSEEHTSELQSHHDLVCRLLLEKKKK